MHLEFFNINLITNKKKTGAFHPNNLETIMVMIMWYRSAILAYVGVLNLNSI